MTASPSSDFGPANVPWALPLRVLHLEDRPDDAKLVFEQLRQAGFDFEYVFADTEAKFLAALETLPDFILADYNLPQFDASRALNHLRARDLDIPLIVVSGSIGEELAVSLLKQGVADYVIKDRLGRLGSAVRHALEERQLRREKRRLEEQLLHHHKMEAVGRLAGGVAHHLNNLLTVVLGHSELLLESLGPRDASRPPVEAIKEAADRAAALTNQLAAFGRRQILRPDRLSLNALIGQIELMFCGLPGDNIEVMTDLDKDAQPVIADPEQIKQVLLTLALNAREAMPSGGKLGIRTGNIDLGPEFGSCVENASKGPYGFVSIRDTGLGMDEETKQHLFEPFFTTKTFSAGTGLGLASIYGIVQQSRGYIEVESKLGEGTTFIIYLPCFVEVSSQAEHPLMTSTVRDASHPFRRTDLRTASGEF